MKYLSLIIIILSILLISFLTYGNRELKTENQALKKDLFELESLRKEHQIFLGRKVSILTVKNKANETVSIDFHKQKLPTILYIFSPSCHWCEKNFKLAVELYNSTKEKYNFVGLSIERDSSNSTDISNLQDIPFPVYSNPSKENYEDYFFRVTPATYVISTDSSVINYWSGAYTENTKPEIEKALSIKLSDLTD
jgi:peroxiredoxin